MPPKSTDPKGDAKKGTDVHNSEKKLADHRMPSKRSDPMKQERQGVQRPPSRVMINSAATPTAAKPFIRSALLPPATRGGAGAGAAASSFGGLQQQPLDEEGAPELDTQWLALRRLQGRYIAGPHGDLLKADGVGSGVTEPFFFSAVRPGSSANKRASAWYGRTVQPMLAPNPLHEEDQKKKKRELANSARSIDPSSTAVPRPASSTGTRRKKNPNPKTLRDWVAFSFGGPQQISAGTLPVTKEVHAQIFPLVRADGNVEIAQVAGHVVSAIAPTMIDAAEIAVHWMERIAARDRAAAEDAAVSAAAAAAAAAGSDDGADQSEVGSASVSVSAAARATAVEADEEAALAVSDKKTAPAPIGAPPGYVPYSILLYAVQQLLTDEKNIDLCYDMCDVCCDGVINKEAIKRQVAVLMGKREQQHSSTTTLLGASYLGQERASESQPPPPLPTAKSAVGLSSDGGTTTVASGSQSLAGGAAPTALSGATSFFGQGGGLTQSKSVVPRAISPTGTLSGTSRGGGGLAAATGGGGGGAPVAARSLRQIHADLQQEQQAYEAMREQHVMTTDEFVAGVIHSTTLGPEAPHRERAPPAGRFWVTARPREPPALVPSPHFHFPISSALMRCFSHIAGFEEYWALFKGKKKKKKGATLPSMRQEHISRAEFGDIFLSDPHVCTPFLPFLLRRVLAALPESDLGPSIEMQQQQQHDGLEGVRSPNRSMASGTFPRRVESQASIASGSG